MKTVGIDASSSCTGLCLFDGLKLVDSTKIKSDKGNGFREASCQMIERVKPIILQYNPDIIYMEDVPTFARKGGRGGNVLQPLIALGSVQGIFYLELQHRLGYNIDFLDLTAWRQGLGFPVGGAKDSDRDHQKDRAVKFANEMFGLDLYYQLGKKSVKDEDDRAEAICLCYSKITGAYDKAIEDRLEKERIKIEKEAKKNNKFKI